MEAMQPRICIQPQSRRSPRYYITMIIRAPSRVFQFQDIQHSFQDCMDYILPGLHWKRFTTPCRRQHHCSLHRCGFSLFNCISSSFLSFYIFWPDRIFISISAGRTVDIYGLWNMNLHLTDGWLQMHNLKATGEPTNVFTWEVTRIIESNTSNPFFHFLD